MQLALRMYAAKKNIFVDPGTSEWSLSGAHAGDPGKRMSILGRPQIQPETRSARHTAALDQDHKQQLILTSITKRATELPMAILPCENPVIPVCGPLAEDRHSAIRAQRDLENAYNPDSTQKKTFP